MGHLGLDDFIARRPGWDRSAAEGGALWVHYGANIGATDGMLSLVSPDAELRELATAELTRAGQKHALAPPDLVPSGETRDIHRAGGRYLTLVGTNGCFICRRIAGPMRSMSRRSCGSPPPRRASCWRSRGADCRAPALDSR